MLAPVNHMIGPFLAQGRVIIIFLALREQKERVEDASRERDTHRERRRECERKRETQNGELAISPKPAAKKQGQWEIKK